MFLKRLSNDTPHGEIDEKKNIPTLRVGEMFFFQDFILAVCRRAKLHLNVLRVAALYPFRFFDSEKVMI